MLPDWKKWLRSAKSTHEPAILTRRHIYILPTRFGYGFAIVVIAMLVGSINYTLSLGFVLTFLLAGIGNMAMLHTWRNLAYLQIKRLRALPVFAGEDALFEISVSDHQTRARYTINAYFEEMPLSTQDISSNDEKIFKLAHSTSKRGWLKPGRIVFFTEFPLGLFHAWSYASIDCQCLVYPSPIINGLPLPTSPDEGASGMMEAGTGDDDFFGHRNYQLGDSPKRVDWKASSKEQGLLVKQFQGESKSTLWIDWASTAGADTELRLQQMVRWILDAHASKIAYGVRMADIEINPDSSEAHFHQCMQTLALWGLHE